ncbi:plasma-membrane proton-efflux P-type ATPase [Acidianus manzaensis]|uniref:Plasma-membrane proton-efflux P-type ATPase n=1 Tax=Acidianus manzaensis TaxID=282676 RepID=A0A1W6JY52_9CREN|nr:plasma-membrane proton-efflux P-type ATPase [Acidianus manzaensis]ARM75175.1 plasma-membrane proton-efflux P-type ATPase [Acidianus manzaensis]
MSNTFENKSIQDTLTAFNTTLEGLTEEEAQQRIKKYGYNEVKEKKQSPVIKFLKKFWAPVPWMLEITTIITYILGKYLDMYIILFLLIFNSVISFIQEKRAENAVELLKQKLNVKTRVLRDKKWKIIEARLLVPGDIVHIRLGDIVPADIKIIEGEVLVDQSALTGESMPVEKKKQNVIYSGSIIKRGEATGIVIATGEKTYFGKTTELVQTAKAESHLEKLIFNIVKYLVILDIALVIALFIFSLLVGIKISTILPFSLIVLIASVPVALPATFTIAMALGSQELANHGVLVTRLTASEDAASMDILNLDKTGTITENRLRVGDPIPAEGFTKEDVVRYAYIASDEASQDPIDTAVISCFRENRITPTNFEKINFTPFDPSIKRTEATVKLNQKILKVMKGAPPVIAQLSDTSNMKDYNKILENLSERGYRTISVAIAEENQKPKLVGILPLYDRPRKDSKDFIEEIKKLNVSPKMVTGDNELIAKEIAKQVDIGDIICNINDIKKILDENQQIKKVEECNVFANVFPEDKYFIVKTLQKGKHYVGMTGDGVNDAPALKQAEVGIAVANATDVAKASASMVLTHEGLTDIVEAIKTGRKIYQRMLTYTINKIIKTLQVVIFLTLSFFIVKFFVTTAFDVILLLFANDFVTMSIATDNVRYSMKPERLDAGKIVKASLILAILILVESFFSLWLGIFLKLSLNQIQTFIFDMLVFSGQFTVYMVRERKSMWSSKPSKFLLTSSIADIIFISTISALGILVYPIPIQYVIMILAISFAFTVIFDHIKSISFKTVGI